MLNKPKMPVKTFYLADNVPYEFQRSSSTDVSEPFTQSAATERSFYGDSILDSYDKDFQNLSELVTPHLSGNVLRNQNLGICKNKIEEEIRKYLICHTYETNHSNEDSINFVFNPFINAIHEKSTNVMKDDVVEPNRFFPTRTSVKVRNHSVMDTSGVNCFTGRAASSVGQCSPAIPVKSYTDPCLSRHITTFLSPAFSFSKCDSDPTPRSIASAIKRKHIRRPTSIRYSSGSRGFTLSRSKDASLLWKQGLNMYSRSLNCPLGRTISIHSVNQTSETYSSMSITQDIGERKFFPSYSTRRKCSSKAPHKPEENLSIKKWQKEGRINYRSVASAIAKETRIKTAKHIRSKRTPRKTESRPPTHANRPRRTHSYEHTCLIPRSAKCPICEEDEPELLYKFQFKPKRVCLCRRERRAPKAINSKVPLQPVPSDPNNNSPVEKYSHRYRFMNNRPKSRYRAGLKNKIGLRKNASSSVWKDLRSGTSRDDGSSILSLSPEEIRFLELHQYDDALSDISYSATISRSSSDMDSNCRGSAYGWH